MATSEEQDAIYHILIYLLEGGVERIRRSDEGRRSGSTMRAIRFSGVNDNQISTSVRFASREGSLEDQHVVPIKPPGKEKNCVAALWCRWNFTEEGKPEVGYYVGLWNPVVLETGDQVREGVQFVGYRYESPEKKGKDHNYYHSQPCRSMGEKSDEIAEALPISHRAPAWPLPAKCPIELLLCVLLSLYGMNELKEFEKWVSERNAARQVEKLMSALKRLIAIEV